MCLVILLFVAAAFLANKDVYIIDKTNMQYYGLFSFHTASHKSVLVLFLR